ncbi:MAG: diaminopimelate epimerase [Flavobacteriales bacterium]|jgi:diaminopimelate epimerase
MRLRFTKMHGLGNDFVMLDAVSQKLNVTEALIRKLANRNFGIGCDQVLVVETPRKPNVDFRYRIFNADGSEVENCGNGARCFAVFARQRGLTSKTSIAVETCGGDMILTVHEDNSVTVNMGVPNFEPASIPFTAEAREPQYSLELNKQTLDISALSVGNPHAVHFVDDLASFPVTEIGPQVEIHSRFPQKVNAGFIQIVSRNEARVRVFERGVGETIACGTGACAAIAAGRQLGLLDETVAVHLGGGTLTISWAGGSSDLMMTGPTATVFHGQINI